MADREAICVQARKYVGMQFLPHGRSRPEDGRAARMDCAGLIVCVGEDLGLRDRTGAAILRTDYIERGGTLMSDFMKNEMRRRLIERAPAEGPQTGDVVTIHSGPILGRAGQPSVISHCGIISEMNLGGHNVPITGLIFAYPMRLRDRVKASRDGVMGRIVEIRLDEHWRTRVDGIFSYPGVA